MMRKSILIGFMLLLLAGAASADQFKILYHERGDTFPVAHAPVTVQDSGGRVVFEGSTDKYGLVEIAVRSGDYDVTVLHREKEWSLSLTIDGSEAVKTRYLRDST